MDHCFLFSKHITDNGCFSLKISSNGTILSPLGPRSFAEIKELQKDSQTTIVEPCTHASLFTLELPWLPERKARVAIPYALEDKVAQAIEELHFTFDKQHYQNNRYLITVIDKQRLRFLMDELDKHFIDFETITLDWFALDPQQLCLSESNVLINNDDFKGALSGSLALTYMKQHILNPTLQFADSTLSSDTAIVQPQEHSYIWIAQQLLKSKPLNLCQGDMQHGNSSDWLKKGYQIVGALCAIWLLSIILVNALTLHSLNKETDKIDEQIAVIYRQFFPEAKQVISPRFRINQLLGAQQEDSQTRFWFLLNEFAKAMKNSAITVEQLRYQNKTLSVTIMSADFASLEDIKNKLSAQLKVNQTEASTHDQQVIATLELM